MITFLLDARPLYEARRCPRPSAIIAVTRVFKLTPS